MAPRATAPPYEVVHFRITKAVDQHFEAEAYHMAAEEKKNKRHRADDTLENTGVRKKKQCVVKKMTGIGVDHHGREK
jgi:hypothetical protein